MIANRKLSDAVERLREILPGGAMIKERRAWENQRRIDTFELARELNDALVARIATVQSRFGDDLAGMLGEWDAVLQSTASQDAKLTALRLLYSNLAIHVSTMSKSSAGPRSNGESLPR